MTSVVAEYRHQFVFLGLLDRLDQLLERGFVVVHEDCGLIGCSDCAAKRSEVEDDFTLAFDAAKLIAEAWQRMFADDPIFGLAMGDWQEALDHRWDRFEYLCNRFDNIKTNSVGSAHKTTKENRS